MKTLPLLFAAIGLCAGTAVADHHADHGTMSAEQKQAHHNDMLPAAGAARPTGPATRSGTPPKR